MRPTGWLLKFRNQVPAGDLSDMEISNVLQGYQLGYLPSCGGCRQEEPVRARGYTSPARRNSVGIA